MKAVQLYALQHVVRCSEDLQKVWDDPRIYKVEGDKNKRWLVTILVAYETPEGKEAQYIWSASARLLSFKRKVLKAVNVWTPTERSKANQILISELDDVGLLMSETESVSPYALIRERKLRVNEQLLIKNKSLLGN